MSRFVPPHDVLDFRDKGGLPYTLLAPLVYESDGLGRTITVPTDFVTDLASIPRIVQNIIPKSGRYDGAAVLHDYAYSTNTMTRQQADYLIREAMEVCHVGRVLRWTIWLAVRAGGWKPWNAYRAKDAVSV